MRCGECGTRCVWECGMRCVGSGDEVWECGMRCGSVGVCDEVCGEL